MYHLRLFRDKVMLKQAEMARELGISVSLYAMMERGDRKVPRSLYPAMKLLAEKYQVAPSEVTMPGEAPQSQAIVELQEKNEKSCIADLYNEANKCAVKIYKLEKDFKRIRKSYNEATEIVNKADMQLPGLKENEAMRSAYAALYLRRKKAMETLKRIAKMNPLKMLIQIKALKQEQLLLEGTMASASDKWLEFTGVKELVNG